MKHTSTLRTRLRANRARIKRLTATFTIWLLVSYACAVLGMAIYQLSIGTEAMLVDWAAAFLFIFWPPIVLMALAAVAMQELEVQDRIGVNQQN